MKRWVLRIAVAGLLASSVGGCLFLSAFRWPVRVHQWNQPTAVNYGSFDPYVVIVYEVSAPLSPWRRYEVWVVKDVSATYGHMTEYGFHRYMESETQADYFLRCAVEWTPDGVTLTEPTGHHLFVPKSAFVGGR